jgi:protein ImuB
MHFCGELREIFLEARNTMRAQPSQATFTSDDRERDTARSYQELLNTFCVRIGKDRVSYAYVKDSHVPEDAYSYGSVADDAKLTHARSVRHPAPLYTPHERPTLMFTPPEPITTIAMLPDRPPSRIQWRNTQLAIQAGFGPERIAPEWWRGDIQRSTFSERDYFTIQDSSGRWLWVYRERSTQAWFIHGVWT